MPVPYMGLHTLCESFEFLTGESTMATGEAIQKIQDRLKCSICLGVYTSPKLLSCGHTFCQDCLLPLAIEDMWGQCTVTCPICRTLTSVPTGGVMCLQTAFHVSDLIEIQESLQKIDLQTARSENSVTLHCFQHVDEASKLFCETCDELICWRCVVKGGKHQGHDHDLVDSAFDSVKGEIVASIEEFEKQKARVDKEFSAKSAEITDQRAVFEANVHETVKQLHEILEARKREVISQIQQISDRKLECLTAQKGNVDVVLSRLNNCAESVMKRLKTDRKEYVLMMKTSILKQVRNLTTDFTSDLFEPVSTSDMSLPDSSNIIAACQNYGQVLAPDLSDPSRCYISGMKSQDSAVPVGEKSTAILHAVNFRGEPHVIPILLWKCELVSEITGTTTRGSIERSGQSQYEISYQPTIKGRHLLHLKLEGQHIRGSPFQVTAKLPVEKLSSPILGIDEVEGPWGVAVNHRGEVVVTELEHRVSVFTPSGKKLRSFGTCGSGPGQFMSPRGVAVDGEGNILVTDSENHRIQKFTAEGSFLTMVGAKGNGPLQFHFPVGIAFNPRNRKLYITDWNHSVQVLNSDLTYSRTFGGRGPDPGQFEYPRGVACDSAGNVYVADRGNCRVQVFTAEGRLLRMFGRRGEGRGELNLPVGVAVDNDVVYVSESENHRVSIFTSEGRHVSSVGQGGLLRHPFGVAVDDSGVIFVCDAHNNCVQLF